MAADSDSPLSAISSVTGILTFVAAIAAALWVYLQVIQNADGEIRSLVLLWNGTYTPEGKASEVGCVPHD